jgi:2,4-dienoyl-CoA reductase-like NADH-dependent reductase (Old Yellow Enzyme family)
MKVFEPITIRGMKFKNRFIMAATSLGAMSLGFDEKRKYVIDFYAERAKGGVAAMIIGGVPINYLNPEENLGQNIPPNKYIEAMGLLVQGVHKYDAKFGVQIWHTNQYPAGARGQMLKPQEWVAPSSRKENQLHYIPMGTELRELTTGEVEAIIRRFAIAAKQVKKTGADFVELHLSHGHMPNQFFSPIHNRREDKYGGSLEGRMRFGIECVQEIRLSVGEQYPIFVRLGVLDEDPHGINITDSTIFAQELEKAGTDCIDVTVGISSYQPHRNFQAPLKKCPMGSFLPMAEKIKNALNIPVVADGRLHNLDLAESAIERGQTDLIGICRQLIADPYWVRKIAEGLCSDIVACDSCNTWCYMVGPHGKLPSHVCRIAKRAGEETENLRCLGLDTPTSTNV